LTQWHESCDVPDVGKEKIPVMEQNQFDSEMSQVLCDILAYAAEHPDAGDTVKGIYQWWLLQQKIKHQESLVRKALAELVERGLMNERQGIDGRTRYQIIPHKQKEIKAFINQKTESKKRNSSK
jgi:hypothetical protein